MRSLLVAFLEMHHLPGWLAPDYAVMVALAGLLGATVALRLAKRDGANVRLDERALLATYVAALLGGYVFEGIRALPDALAAGSLSPILRAGRAAYGGLLAGALAAAWVLRRGGAPVLPFLDRAVPLCGFSYGFVRLGCFLAGCDYGRPTGGALGVRFPAGSPAALDHAARGWVPRNAPSLPVHPTQLYEAALGLLAAGLASLFLRREKRDGRAFGAFLAMYAAGRFFVELLRGDGGRGVYGPLSTAQIVSLGLLLGIGALVLHAKLTMRLAPLAASLLAACILSTSAASAAPEEGKKPAGQPAPAPTPTQALPPAPPVPQAMPYPYPYPYPPPPPGAAPSPSAKAPEGEPATLEAPSDPQREMNRRMLGVGLSGGGYFAPGRFAVKDGATLDLELTWQIPMSARQRIEVGLDGRYVRTNDTSQGGIGIPLRLVSGLGRFAELDAAVIPFYARVIFDSPHFESVNALGARFELAFGFPIASRLAIGLTPLAFGLMGSGDVDLLFTYEPKFWVKLTPL